MFPAIDFTLEKHVRDFEISIEEDLISYLRMFKDASFTEKNDLPLFSGGVFDTTLNPETPKCRANLGLTTCLVYDFDGSDVPPEVVIEAYFQDVATIAYGSWNHGNTAKGDGYRFRIVLPFSRHLEETGGSCLYEALWDYMSRDLHDPIFALDTSKRGAQSFFYLPARSVYTDDNIWIENLANPLLDPVAILSSPVCQEWWQATIKEQEAQQAAIELQYASKAPPAPLSEQFQLERAEKALERYASPDEGHNTFFQYAMSLSKNAKLPPAQIEQLLRQNANRFGTNTSDRLAEIKHIMKKL